MARWVWGGAVVIALFTTWFHWKDDSLLPEARRWIEQEVADGAVQSRSFAYLLGIDAPRDHDPELFGRTRLNRAVSAIQNTVSGTDMPRLELPSGDAFCRTRREKCLQYVLEQGAALQTYIEEHEHVLKRYQHFLDFDEFNSAMPTSAESIVPPFSYLSTGNKLRQFEIIVQASRGEQQEATSALDSTLSRLRYHLALADTLTQKIFIASLISDNLDLAAGLYSKALLLPLNNLQDLEPQEITLEQPIRRAFLNHAHSFMQISKSSQSASTESKQPSQFEFKKNRSINDLFVELQQLMVRSSLPAALVDDAFLAHRKSRAKAPLYSLSNPVGSIVVNTVVNLEPVVFRLRDLNCKLKLVRIRMQVPSSTGLDLLAKLPDSVDISNPYEPAELLALNEQNKTICFSGPEIHNSAGRCIAL